MMLFLGLDLGVFVGAYITVLLLTCLCIHSFQDMGFQKVDAFVEGHIPVKVAPGSSRAMVMLCYVIVKIYRVC